MITLSILSLYTFIRPLAITKVVEKPTLQSFTSLLRYADTLNCPCSSISNRYSTFVKIQPSFHAVSDRGCSVMEANTFHTIERTFCLQMCSSAFITKEWRENLTRTLDISLIASTDYRQFISAHFGLLASLCQLSIATTNDAVIAFLTSSFTSANLLRESVFTSLIQQLIDQALQSTSVASMRMLTMQRVLMRRNAIITKYGTNWNYNVTRPYLFNESHSWFPVDSLSVDYPDGCSCGRTASSCTAQATFLNQSNGQAIEVKGFKRGCLPSESLFASTFECLYDVACVQIIAEQMHMDEVSICASEILTFVYFRTHLFLIRLNQVVDIRSTARSSRSLNDGS